MGSGILMNTHVNKNQAHGQQPTAREKGMSRIPGNPSNRFWLYLLPGFLMLLWIIIVPAVWNIYLSFTNYRGIKPPQFAGLTNWVRLMKDTTFWVSFCNSIWMIIAMVVVPILLGLILSSLVFDVVQKKFGPKVASIVDGLTKISGVMGSDTSRQAESFRKMILTLADDVRVILIKIADRLHNMRTLASMPEHKQVKIASETLYIYAPLAHRMGLHAIKTELEDLSMKYEHPEEYEVIDKKIEAYEKQFSLKNLSSRYVKV